MALITITREDVTYSINSNLAEVNKFTDMQGNVAYIANINGLGRLELTESEYDQFTENNKEMD